MPQDGRPSDLRFRALLSEELVAKVVRVNGRSYSALGEIIDELARKRNVRGPQPIANYMKARLGEAPTGTAVSKWMYGDSRPTRENMQRFADAFELSKAEKITLSFAYTYGQQPPEDEYLGPMS